MSAAYTEAEEYGKMASTHTDVDPHVRVNAPQGRSAHGKSAASDVTTVGMPPQRALALSDAHGHRALVWRDDHGWVIACDDQAFKRRIQRALRRPVWIREDVATLDGDRWSTLVKLPPQDPRYARQLFWNWQQLRLRGVAVEVVSLPAEPGGVTSG